MMITVMNSVLSQKQRILKETMNFQEFCLARHNDVDYAKNVIALDNYFNGFSEDEVMVIQAIMYYGRDCYTQDDNSIAPTKLGVIQHYVNNLFGGLGKPINKDIEISQMTGKGRKIGEYFNIGFKELDKLL